MTVVVLTGGSRGDVEPYVGLAVGLRRAGLTVRVATHDGFRDLVESHGLEFAHVAEPSQAVVEDSRWAELGRDADSGFRFARRLRRVRAGLEPIIETMLDDHWAACRGASAVVSSLSAFAGADQAAALGVPHCWALLQPVTPTRAYPHFATPARLHLPAALNPYSYGVADAIVAFVLGAPVRRWLARTFGTSRPLGVRPPIVYGISPTILPLPPDRPPGIKQFGSWTLPVAKPLGADVEAFLDADRRPTVFVHAAAIGSGDQLSAAHLVRALRRGRLRAIASGIPIDQREDDLLPVGAPAFPSLFARVAAVVHHGGAGTMTWALRAGRPSLGVPGSFDQSFWSGRAAALGVGPPPVPARRLGARRLDEVLVRLVSTSSYRTHAADIARRMRGERGVDDTVAHLVRLFDAAAPVAA